MLMCGCSHELAEIVQTEKDPEVLDKAINTLGLVGGDESLAALTKVYNSQADVCDEKESHQCIVSARRRERDGRSG